jgi:rfaE bifunctional protein nucleotidyltransferase chain/domain
MPRTPESKIVPFSDLAALSTQLHNKKLNLITTNGCFDLLHWGHLKYLSDARLLGDLLICGVNSDRSVKKLKGPSRPLCTERERALQLASLESVDYVTIFDDETPIRFLEQVKPAVHVKGGDYEGKVLPETEVIERFGGTLRFLPFIPGYSTTKLIERFLNMKTEKHTP